MLNANPLLYFVHYTNKMNFQIARKQSDCFCCYIFYNDDKTKDVA